MLKLGAISILLGLVVWVAYPTAEETVECQSCTARHNALQKLQSARQALQQMDNESLAEVAVGD